MRAALYTRVSSAEQRINGQSLPAQEKALVDYCKDKGIEIYQVYTDAGISAHISYKKRPALQKMIRDAQGHLFDIILLTKLDRFFRSVPDYYATMGQIDIPWRAIWEDYETETSAGVFKVNIMLSIAQAESDRTSERVKSIVEYKRSIGEYIGSRMPPGYKRIDGKNIVKDEAVRGIVEDFIKDYIRTLSLSDSVQNAKLNGLNLTRFKAKEILTLPIYRGEIQNIEGYIAPDQVHIIDESIARRTRKPKEQQNVYLFAGLLTCPICGRKMLSVTHYSQRKDGHSDKYRGYRCGGSLEYQCKSSYLGEAPIERRLLAELSSVASYKPQIATFEQKTNTSLSKKIKALKSRLTRLSELYEMGDISKEEYIQKRDSTKVEIARAEASVVSDNIPTLPEGWREIYDSLDREHKKMFWNKILQNVVISKEELRVTYL